MKEVEILCNSILHGHVSCQDVELLIDSFTSCSLDRCYNGFSPLCLACKLNRYDLVVLLLRKGADPNFASYYLGKYPLHFACDHSNGNLELVKHLLKEGAEVNVRDADGNTGLHLACTESNVVVVQCLLEAGADVMITDVDDETPLVRACYAKSVELVDILIKANSDANYPHGLPLEIAVRAPSLEVLKLLIAGGAEVTRNTYLGFASEHNYLDMMKVLHNYGVDVNLRGALGLTALHHACISRESSEEAVRLLLLWGADVHLVSATGDTALHYACQSFAVEKAKLLLDFGTYVNMQDGTQLTPLLTTLTTRCQHEETSQCLTLVKLLLASGARIQADTLERLKVLIVYLQSSQQDKDSLFRLLMDYATSPLPLQYICRIHIRARVPANKHDHVQHLPLPKSVIAFLQFDDLFSTD